VVFLATFLVAFFSDRLAGFLPTAFLGERVAFFVVVFFGIAMSLAPPERAPGAAMIFPLGTLRGEAAQTKTWPGGALRYIHATPSICSNRLCIEPVFGEMRQDEFDFMQHFSGETDA
jgi:hypothetical protein